MNKKAKAKVNAFQAKKAAGEIDVAAQDAEMAMFAPQPSHEKYAMEVAQWKKQKARSQARFNRIKVYQAERESKPITIRAAYTQAIKISARMERDAARAYVAMENKHGKWIDNRKSKDPSFTEEIDNENARIEMAGASWRFLIEMIEDNGDESELMKLRIALESDDWEDGQVYHAVYTLGNVIAGNIELKGKLTDTLVDTETFKWSDHKQYITRIVHFMNRQVRTQFIAERLSEYNAVDKMVRFNRDLDADRIGDNDAFDKGQKIPPSFKAINDDVLRTLALSY